MTITQNEYRAMQKRAGICRDCGQEDAYTMMGRTYCAECAEKVRLLREKRYARPEEKAKICSAQKRLRDKRRLEGRCPTCGRKAESGYVTCAYCRARSRKNADKQRRKAGVQTWTQRTASNRCFICGAEPVKGKRLCKACMAKKMENIVNSNPEKVYRPISEYVEAE